MTPQAGRGPALPVLRDSSLPPLPRSSVPAWTTTVRYICSQHNPFIIVGHRVWWNTYANDGLGANQLNELVLEAALGVALSIGLQVAEVTNVAVLVGAVTVGLVVRVD